MYERPCWAVPKDPQSRRTCLRIHCTPEPGQVEPALRAVRAHLRGDACYELPRASDARPAIARMRSTVSRFPITSE